MTEWVISYGDSDTNKVNQALREQPEIAWSHTKHTKTIVAGDIVFLYEKDPVRAIRWKCRVTAADCKNSTALSRYFKEDSADAPFRSHDQPYLEVHHIKPLSEGGADDLKNTAALCPNCHRRMHSLKDPQDIKALTARAGKE